MHASLSAAGVDGRAQCSRDSRSWIHDGAQLGANGYSDIALRDAIKAGDVPGPRMLVSGPALGITGGHADKNFLAPQYHWSDDGVADGVDGVTLKVREDIKYGADVIKFMATGGVLSEGDNPALAQ